MGGDWGLFGQECRRGPRWPFVSVGAAAGGVLVKATFLKGVVLGSVVSLVMLTATAAFAGSGVGGVFNLGKYNGVNGATALAGSTAGNQLHVTNVSNGTGATGIGITVHSGKPPLTVNSSTQVPNLNASYVGGISQGKLVHGTGTVPQSGLILINPGEEVFLGSVPNIGGLWGDCQNPNTVHASVVLKTNNALPQFVFVNSSGGAALIGGGRTLGITPDTAGMVATAQISSGTHTATIVVSAVDDGLHCAFSAQSTSSG
jgi:hypothetical protein